MKSTAATVTRATRPALVRTETSPTLAPRPEDAPNRVGPEFEITAHVFADLCEDRYTAADGTTFVGYTHSLHWKGTVVREMEAEGEDPADGVVVHLSVSSSQVHSFDPALSKPSQGTMTDIDLGRLASLSVPEFRKMLAALNALAAALPAEPDFGR